MKIFAFPLLAVVLLAGCTNLGYNPNAVDNDMTPGVTAKTYVRNWETDENGKPKPTVKEVKDDPASPPSKQPDTRAELPPGPPSHRR